MAEENRIKSFVKRHKGKIIFAGTAVATIFGTVLLVKNLEAMNNVSNSKLLPVIPDEPQVIASDPIIKIVDVREHLRNLPDGYHASANKIQEAAENGIALAANQTWVSKHPRCYAA